MEQLPPDLVDLGDLTLRRWVPERDLDSLIELIDGSLEHLRPWMPWVEQHSREATIAYLDRAETGWREGTAFNYAVVAGGRLIGNSSFFRRAPEDDPAGLEVGYWLHPAATGHGYMTRAARALTELALARPGVRYTTIVTDEANTRSGAVARRLGYVVHERNPVEPTTSGEIGIDLVWRYTPPA
ncbi:acetyltransferase [Kitasatospora sp. MMS16-BH015]|uniref:GNAT family N-acetyltransferase n=1 Tax=Kitasatospora sp. MMS16-BH015 TaxID=2018025 RepID=UPI000CA0CFE5|nr:GNAT family N-acetyltransferase [Kitasatospora sp. MMS16-BH015]AUG75273.1 acetyltransferase [Kitasatospora sp. MMS16-BH015]